MSNFSVADPELLKEDVVRLGHLAEIRAAGIDPFPAQSARTHTLLAARSVAIGELVTVAGRLMSRRSMGKLSFGHLKDFSGQLQAVFSASEVGDKPYDWFVKNFDVGDFIEVSGEIFTTKKGEVSVKVKTYRLLAKALLPLPEKWHGLTDVEQRYRKRYLDLIMNQEALSRMLVRSKIITALRNFLDGQGFVEIETPALQIIYGGGFARPFITRHHALKTDFYLRISDEMYLKRAIIGGFEKVYEIAKVFRNEGIDHDHNPEFTMFEAQIAYQDYRYGMDLFEEIFEHCALNALGTTDILHAGVTISVKRPWKRLRLVEAVQTIGKFAFVPHDTVESAKINLVKRLKDKKKIEELQAKQSLGEVLAYAFEELVEEHLIQPTIIYDYPVEVSPLAKKADDQRFTERFEAFALGSEIGNNYSELNDPLDLAQRFIEEKKKETAGFAEAHQIDYDYLEAVKHGMPPSCGLGIGLDRLAMLFTGVKNIKEVILFPTLRPEK